MYAAADDKKTPVKTRAKHVLYYVLIMLGIIIVGGIGAYFMFRRR
jgi:hypothetical protein